MANDDKYFSQLAILIIIVIFILPFAEKQTKKSSIPFDRKQKYEIPIHYTKEPQRQKYYETFSYEASKHASSRCKGNEASPDWPFAMVATGRSETGKTNLLANLVLGDKGHKGEYIQKRRKGESRYIRCDDLIVCGYHPDEPKWHL